MHADKGGPVYINGKKAKLKKSGANESVGRLGWSCPLEP
jgi:hypothetical protein